MYFYSTLKIPMKYSLFIFLFFAITLSIYSEAKGIENIDSLRIDTLQSEIENLTDSLSKVKEKLNNLKIDYDIVNQSLSGANNIIQLSGWVGILVTIIIVFYAFFSTVRHERTLQRVNARLTEAEATFNNFISSPEKINEALERMNYNISEKFLFSDKEEELSEGLQKVYTLSRPNRQTLADKIKNNLLSSNLRGNIKVQMYYFVSSNFTGNISKYSLDIYNNSTQQDKNSLSYTLIQNIFSEKPYPISPIDFISNSSNKTQELSYLISRISLQDLKLMFKELLQNNIEVDFAQLSYKLDKKEMTDFVNENFNLINEKVFNEVKVNLQYDKELIIKVFERNKDLKNLNSYITENISDVTSYKILFDLVDISNSENWISLFKLYLPKLSVQSKKSFLQSEFESKKNTLPKTDFFEIILPLLFEDNYGVKGKPPIVTFNGKPLVIHQSAPFFMGGVIRNAVYHPILSVEVFV